MKNHSLLLRWLSAFALAACLVASRGAAAQIKMSIGWDPPTNDHPYAGAGNDFKRRVEQYTKVRFRSRPTAASRWAAKKRW
ncbi:MAG: hypothetical protein ABI533_04190 [Betaproteobacteria bacterium]